MVLIVFSEIKYGFWFYKNTWIQKVHTWNKQYCKIVYS